MLVPQRPCPECPWRKDTPPGQFPAERYAVLRKTSPADGYGPDMGAPMFACHKSPEGREHVCAGWLASVGQAHPGVRLNVAIGVLNMCALKPKADWPELHDDYDTMASEKGIGYGLHLQGLDEGTRWGSDEAR